MIESVLAYSGCDIGRNLRLGSASGDGRKQ
jgi:hypothetical protein